MDFHDKDFFDRLMNLTEENNKILLGLRRSARFSRYLRILYALIIIGISIGAFYYIQPFIDGLLSFTGINSEAVRNAIIPPTP